MKGQTNQDILDHQLQRHLRRNPTDAERSLWKHLRGSQVEGVKFRRQHPYLDYILDFVCLERKLVVEVDGGQHAESGGDRERDRRLEEAGFRVLRFWNNEVLGEIEAVLEVIRGALVKAPSPHPHPNPSRAGFAQPARSVGAERCSAKPRPHPLEGEGATPRPSSEGPPLPLQGEGRDGGGVPNAPGAPAC